MKKILLAVLSVLMVFVLYSCTKQGGSTVSSESQGNSSTAIKILQKSFENNKDNMVISGLSIDFVLCMLANGAKDKALSELEGFLDSKTYTATAELQKKVQNLSDTLKISNAIWGTEFRKEYRTAMKEKLKVYVQTLPNNTKIINNWVAEATQNEITDLFSEQSTSPLEFYVVNTIFFQDTWKIPFNEEITRDESFHSLSGETQKVPMMHLTADVEYANSNGIQSIKLKYKEKGWMSLYLPKEGSDFGDFIKNLSKGLPNMNYETKEVEISMPKYEIKTSTDIKSIFKSLGMSEIFNDKAHNFEPMVDSGVASYIKDIKQKAVVKVDEKGTKATSATGVEGAIAMGINDDPVKFTANRPFLFYISEGDFIGVYTGKGK